MDLMHHRHCPLCPVHSLVPHSVWYFSEYQPDCLPLLVVHRLSAVTRMMLVRLVQLMVRMLESEWHKKNERKKKTKCKLSDRVLIWLPVDWKQVVGFFDGTMVMTRNTRAVKFKNFNGMRIWILQLSGDLGLLFFVLFFFSLARKNCEFYFGWK